MVSYALERLFADQDRDWVIDCVPAVLAWVPGKAKNRRTQPFRFAVEEIRSSVTRHVDIDLSWSEAALEHLVPGVKDHARRLRAKASVQREHVTELAAYGLAFVAISTLMPGRRVIHMPPGMAPDMLFDVTPGALRGVEASGRATGGQAALRVVRDGDATRPGKARTLLARADIAEVHLSLWCASPRIAMMEQVKP